MSGIYDLCLGTYSICGANVVPLFMFNFWCLMDFDRFVKYNNVLDEIEKKLPRKCTLLDNQTRATICVWVQVLSAVHDQYWSTASHIFDSISVLIRFWLWAVGQNQFHVLCSTSCTAGIFFERLENHTRTHSRFCGCFRCQSHIQKREITTSNRVEKKSFIIFDKSGILGPMD